MFRVETRVAISSDKKKSKNTYKILKVASIVHSLSFITHSLLNLLKFIKMFRSFQIEERIEEVTTTYASDEDSRESLLPVKNAHRVPFPELGMDIIDRKRNLI